MPDRYCQQCGAELNDASYCPECGAAVGVADETDSDDAATSMDGDSWDWSDPVGPFWSPRRTLGTLNVLGFVSFLLAIGLNAVGLPITAFPHPLPIAMFAYWAGVIFVGFPMWGLLHITDNVLGFLKTN